MSTRRTQLELPETKPATELIDGRLVQKLGGNLRHQALELRWTLAIRAWCGDTGDAIHECRHEFRAPGHSFASLVPDIAYLSRESLDELGPAASEAPPRTPEIAVEILSASEPEQDFTWKIGAYLGAGTRVVFVVDPPKRTVVAHARDGVQRFGPGDVVRHATMVGFEHAVDAMFEGLYLG